MQSRITSPALSVPDAPNALQAPGKAANEAARQAGLPRMTLHLVSVRTSQINCCADCLDTHARGVKTAGEKEEREG